MNNRETKNNNCLLSRTSRVIGFFVSFFLFSIILYNVLAYFDKIPYECGYVCVALGVATALLLSYLFKNW